MIQIRLEVDTQVVVTIIVGQSTILVLLVLIREAIVQEWEVMAEEQAKIQLQTTMEEL